MTLQEIAKLANVSTATVSRTINRVSTVNPVLSRRVRRVIDQVGYYPNTHARALVSGRSRTFGLFVSEIVNPFFPEIVHRFTQLGLKHRYQVLLSSITHDSNECEIAAQQMIERRVDGVAILTFGSEESYIQTLLSSRIPVFAVDINLPGALLKTVHIDYQHGIRQAVQHLAALGHVRIAFVSGPRHFRTAMMRKVAFQDCVNEIGLNTPSELLVEGDHTMEGGMKAMSMLAGLPNRPSAVICSNDLTAIGVMRQAFELSLDVPRDLSVVGFDGIRLAHFMIPPLTTVQMSQTEIAEAAFSALLQVLEPHPSHPASEVGTIRTNLVLRCSTGLVAHRRRNPASGADLFDERAVI